MILGVDLVYSTWQAFSQALLIDSPLLSYIDVQHANFLPPFLTIGEAQDLSPKYTTAKDRAPMRDESAERVSLSRRVHMPVKVQDAPGQVTKPAQVETDQDVAMVTRRKMTVARFIPNAQPLAQPQGEDWAPPFPATSCPKKKQKVGSSPPKSPVMFL